MSERGAALRGGAVRRVSNPCRMLPGFVLEGELPYVSASLGGLPTSGDPDVHRDGRLRGGASRAAWAAISASTQRLTSQACLTSSTVGVATRLRR